MFPPSYQRYVDLVPESDIVAALEEQGRKTASLLHSIDEEKASFRYTPDKWSVKGVDENAYASAADFDRRSMRDLADDYDAARRSTVAFFKSLSEEAWSRSGVANEVAVDVRGLAYITIGHERHHLRVLRDRYGV